MTERPHLGWSAAVLVGLGTLALVAFVPSAWGWWNGHVTAALPQGLLQAAFVGAVLTYLGEALCAMQLVRRLGLEAERARWLWRPSARLSSTHAAAVEFHGLEPLPGVAYVLWDV